MGLFVGGAPVTAVYVGSTPVTAVYVGAEKIWPTREVVQITLGTGTEARDQFRAALSSRGLDYATATEIPFDIELVGTGSVRDMFRDCASLTMVPAMDTSQVTNMYGMFYGCAALTDVPDMDTSGVTNMSGMFNRCSSLTAVPDMDTSGVTDMSYMFYNCAALTDGNVRLIGRHPNVTTTSMITNSGLTREPFVVQIALGTGTQARDQFRAALTERGLDYTTATEIPFDIELVGTGSTESMFDNCSSLATVPYLGASSVTNMEYMFWACSSLTSVPNMDTSQVTNMEGMFGSCESLTAVPDLDTGSATNVEYMFYDCPSLTDGNVRLIGRHPNVSTTDMILSSGLTREPFYDAAGNPI